jgi:hypothetical protein
MDMYIKCDSIECLAKVFESMSTVIDYVDHLGAHLAGYELCMCLCSRVMNVCTK